jgi:hypothetical protein
LDKTIKYLVNEHHYKNVKPVEDAAGHFASVMRDPLSQRFYLLAKGSRMMRDVISCQAYLPNMAAQEKSPIVLVWFNPENQNLRFYLFDPTSILQFVQEQIEKYGEDAQYGYNDREYKQSIRMINFSIKLGVTFDPVMSVEAVWKKTRDPQTKLG